VPAVAGRKKGPLRKFAIHSARNIAIIAQSPPRLTLLWGARVAPSVNLLHRHIFKQVVIAAALAVGVFVFVLVLGNVMREVLDRMASGQIDLPMFFYLLVLLIPGVIPYALPLGLLTAVLLVVGRICAQREYTAMRAAGLSLWSLAAPILLAACLGVLLCLFINFDYAPAADAAYKNSLGNYIRENPGNLFQRGADVRQFSGYFIHVGDREGDDLQNIWIWKYDDQNRATDAIHANHGHLDYNSTTQLITLNLQDGFAQSFSGNDPENMLDDSRPGIHFVTLKESFSLNDLYGKQQDVSKLSLMTLGQLLQKRDEPPPNIPHPTAKQMALWRMDVQMQIQRDFASAFSVLSLALLGLPLSLRIGRAESFANLALALGLALAYYFLLFAIGLLRTHPEMRPDLLLWLPNFIFEALGGWLLYRAAKR
jgi:lipopolysaccharide export system permease protein